MSELGRQCCWLVFVVAIVEAVFAVAMMVAG